VPKRTKKALKSNTRLQQISKVAASLFVKKGYMQTTTKEIAGACNISIGTLYYYIKSKNDFIKIFTEIHASDVHNWEKEIRKEMLSVSPEEMLKIAVRKFAYLIDKRQEMIIFWYNVSRYLTREQLESTINVELRIVTLFKEIIELGCRKGQFKTFDPLVTAYNILMLCDTWALKRWYFRHLYTIEEYAKRCEKLAVSMARGCIDYKTT
jgi:AcrR family transcriptional regulator